MTRSRKRLDFYAWYPGDFRQDTQHLTREERHAYRDLIDEIFITSQDTCSLPDDDILLARITQRSVEEWKAMRYALLDGPRPLLQKRGKTIHSPRLTEEIRKAQAKSLRSQDSASQRWNANAMRTQSECIQSASSSNSLSVSPSLSGESEGETVDESAFEMIWADYPNKDGRKMALRHFLGSVKTADDLAAIHGALEKYVAHLRANPWKRAKNGSTWFNNWRDWVNWTEPAQPQERTNGFDDRKPATDRRPVPFTLVRPK